MMSLLFSTPWSWALHGTEWRYNGGEHVLAPQEVPNGVQARRPSTRIGVGHRLARTPSWVQSTVIPGVHVDGVEISSSRGLFLACFLAVSQYSTIRFSVIFTLSLRHTYKVHVNTLVPPPKCPLVSARARPFFRQTVMINETGMFALVARGRGRGRGRMACFPLVENLVEP